MSGTEHRRAWRRDLARALPRYLAWQTPSWALQAVLLGGLVRFLDVPVWAAALVLGLSIAKDLVLFPAMLVALRPSAHSPWPIGERGQAIEPLEPSGYVRVNGELWRAEDSSSSPSSRIAAGDVVVVRSARGLTLLVEAEAHTTSPSPSAQPPTGPRA